MNQITIQLELGLEHIYQLNLALYKQTKKVYQKIPNIPKMVQLCFNFKFKKERKIKSKLKTAVIIAGLLAIYFLS